jgi:hypothetical protein
MLVKKTLKLQQTDAAQLDAASLTLSLFLALVIVIF